MARRIHLVKIAGSQGNFVTDEVDQKSPGDANEAADRLFGHKLHCKSRQLRFADLAPDDRAKRVLKPAKELETIAQKNPDSCEIYQPCWILDVYPDLPDDQRPRGVVLRTAGLFWAAFVSGFYSGFNAIQVLIL